MSDDDPRLLRSDNGTKNLHRNIFDETKLLCHFLVTLLFRTQDGVSDVAFRAFVVTFSLFRGLKKRL